MSRLASASSECSARQEPDGAPTPQRKSWIRDSSCAVTCRRLCIAGPETLPPAFVLMPWLSSAAQAFRWDCHRCVRRPAASSRRIPFHWHVASPFALRAAARVRDDEIRHTLRRNAQEASVMTREAGPPPTASHTPTTARARPRAGAATCAAGPPSTERELCTYIIYTLMSASPRTLLHQASAHFPFNAWHEFCTPAHGCTVDLCCKACYVRPPACPIGMPAPPRHLRPASASSLITPPLPIRQRHFPYSKGASCLLPAGSGLAARVQSVFLHCAVACPQPTTRRLAARQSIQLS